MSPVPIVAAYVEEDAHGNPQSHHSRRRTNGGSRPQHRIARAQQPSLGDRIDPAKGDGSGRPTALRSKLATDHLISVGCRKIGFVGIRVNAYEARFAGFRRSLERARIPFSPEMELDFSSTNDEAKLKLSHLVRKVGVDGVVCVNDVIALRVIRSLHEVGIKVPQDVAVVGFDNIQAGTTSMPSLSTIDYNKYEMGREAARLLFATLQGSTPAGDASYTLEPQLIVRESTLR